MRVLALVCALIGVANGAACLGCSATYLADYDGGTPCSDYDQVTGQWKDFCEMDIHADTCLTPAMVCPQCGCTPEGTECPAVSVCPGADPTEPPTDPPVEPPTEPPTEPNPFFGLEGGFFDKNPDTAEQKVDKDSADDGSNYKVGKYTIGGIEFKAKDFDVEGSGHGDAIITSSVPANDEDGNPIAFGEWEGLNLKVDDDLGLICQVIYDISNDSDLTQLFGDWFECEEATARRRALNMWLASGLKMPGSEVMKYYNRARLAASENL